MPAGWPPWWNWELELSGHLQRRMEERGFAETDVRAMIEHARLLVPDREPGRWIASARLRGRQWLVVLEPDEERRTVVVITAYTR